MGLVGQEGELCQKDLLRMDLHWMVVAICFEGGLLPGKRAGSVTKNVIVVNYFVH